MAPQAAAPAAAAAGVAPWLLVLLEGGACRNAVIHAHVMLQCRARQDRSSRADQCGHACADTHTCAVPPGTLPCPDLGWGLRRSSQSWSGLTVQGTLTTPRPQRPATEPWPLQGLWRALPPAAAAHMRKQRLGQLGSEPKGFWRAFRACVPHLQVLYEPLQALPHGF